MKNPSRCPTSAVTLSMAMWEELTSAEVVTLGDALFRAKRRVAAQGGDANFLNSVNLFGDPAMRVDLDSDAQNLSINDGSTVGRSG